MGVNNNPSNPDPPEQPRRPPPACARGRMLSVWSPARSGVTLGGGLRPVSSAILSPVAQSFASVALKNGTQLETGYYRVYLTVLDKVQPVVVKHRVKDAQGKLTDVNVEVCHATFVSFLALTAASRSTWLSSSGILLLRT